MSSVERLITALTKLPSVGRRSATRMALHLLSSKENVMHHVIASLQEAYDTVAYCSLCGNLCEHDPCQICTDSHRSSRKLCVVEDVSDLWALEQSGVFRGRYHVLGGVLSPMRGISPEHLRIALLEKRVQEEDIDEIILAMNLTVDGQATAHYITEVLEPYHKKITALAHGIPLGGELEYLDAGTLQAALTQRREL